VFIGAAGRPGASASGFFYIFFVAFILLFTAAV
jgi:hypothetical protein